MKPTLYIFAGFPGSGKTTLAQRLAQRCHAAYLRIDTMEQGIRDLCGFPVTAEGYRLAYRVAKDNLSLGIDVVADSCNPIVLTRDEWEDVARESDSHFLHLEITCSDKAEHRRRVESRISSIVGLRQPAWNEVESREYHAWDRDRLLIDTAGKAIDESFEDILRVIKVRQAEQ